MRGNFPFGFVLFMACLVASMWFVANEGQKSLDAHDAAIRAIAAEACK